MSMKALEICSLSASAETGRRSRAGHGGARKDATNSVPATVATTRIAP